MCIMDEQITPKSGGREIVNTACAVCDIAHDHSIHTETELRYDVGNSGREEQQAFRELQSDLL